MRERFLDPSAWRRTMDGWRLTVNGHTVDLCEGPPGHFTPIVDWLTHYTAFPGAPCPDVRAAIAYAWPLVAGALGGAAAGAPAPSPSVASPR